MDEHEKGPFAGARDQDFRAALDQHWAASDANDFEAEHRIYHEDAVLYPHSGERTRGRFNYRINAPFNRPRNDLLYSESLEAVIFGSPNSS